MSKAIAVETAAHERYAPYLVRYRSGEWRDRILHDLILEDARALGRPLTILDIGCGRGFDDNLELQQSIAKHARAMIGIEPDPEVETGPHFTRVHRCLFEDAELQPASVDIAYAVMVLEHLANPQSFWDKLHEVLVPGGVFWGLTVDSRTPFAVASYWSERLRLKNIYMRSMWGNRGEDRYLNYPVHYMTNSPRQVEPYVERFSTCEVINFSRSDQMSRVLPGALLPVARCYDDWIIRTGRPGTLLALRVTK